MNGVNQALFIQRDKKILRRELSLPIDKPLFLFAGNFNEEKGLEVLIKAFSSIAEDYTEPQLIVVGSGPLERSIYDLVAELGLENRIQFIGRVPHTVVADYLAAVDFLCLPSLREGCPNIVLESLSSQTPVLSSHVGAVPEMLASNSKPLGLLAKPNDAEDFSRILKESLSTNWDKNLEFKWMSWQESADKIAEVLNSVVAPS